MTTELQTKMIRAIARNQYQPTGGGEPASFDDLDWVWADSVIVTPSDKGTFTSLMNAGLVEHSGHGEEDECVRLTEAGFDAYKLNQ
jgi:6-phosphogluconolactonase/glucosamine-6-phosphate isomerase/deaminase